mgnify:CR=1 FL=1
MVRNVRIIKMPNKKISLHIQQNTTIDRVAGILDYLNGHEIDIHQLEYICNLRYSVLQKNVFPFLRQINILDKDNPPKLTSLGKIASEISYSNSDLLGDFFHLIIYSLHLKEPDKRLSWAYARLAQTLWLREEVMLSTSEKKSLVTEVIEKASEKFSLPPSEISFSDSSISGCLNWLRTLQPNVITRQGKVDFFSRRYFCTAPVLVKAIDILYQYKQRTYGVKVFLREEIRKFICKMLLLDPQGLDNSLENAMRTYSYDQGGFFDYGYEGGYGQWIMLTLSPQWDELF